MLIVALLLAPILLVLANRFARRWPRPLDGVSGWEVAMIVIGCFGTLALLPLVLQTVLMAAALALCVWWGRTRRLFLALSCAATVLAFGVTGWMALATQRDQDRLRQRYPYESMETRLPWRAAPATTTLSEGARQRLDHLDRKIAQRFGGRSRQLETLHERTVALFVNSQSFGVGRLPQLLAYVGSLKYEPKPKPPVPQPAPRRPSWWSGGTLGEARPVPDGPQAFGLDRLHDAGVFDFVYPDGFGYVKDRHHVAGFLPHRFREVPEPAGRWSVQTLDLIGLVLHEQPVAYVSEYLPRMEELREAPTRPLDAFEAAGLEVLRRGEDLYLGKTADGLRMVGALRSASQCVECHGGERGELLGAFSYTLREGG